MLNESSLFVKYMSILLAGYPEKTKNYAAMLQSCNVSFDITLQPKNPAAYEKLLLPGGGDVAPSFYGELNTASKDIDSILDQRQFFLLDAFVRLNRPILGICRGIQLINIYFGGTLQQELSTHATHEWKQQDQFHPVFNEKNSIFHRLYGNSCLVNSAHHQGIAQLGNELEITQIASDGVVEGIQHKKNPILAVQWHPERTGLSFSPSAQLANGKLLIQYFLEHL